MRSNYKMILKGTEQIDPELDKMIATGGDPVVGSRFQKGKKRRHKRKVRRLSSLGVGKAWSAPSVVFRVELVWENKLGEQANFSLHWIQVRKIEGRERQKYLDYFYNYGSPLSKGETIELRHLLCYLDSYYQENVLLKPERPQINTAFIYEAAKVGDKAIRYPLACRVWDKKNFLSVPLDKHVLAIFHNTIWHQFE